MSQLLGECTKRAQPVYQEKQVPKDADLFSSAVKLGVDSVQVDSTFINVPSTRLDPACYKYGRVQARSDGKVGYISYDEKAAMYSITYAFPGLGDEQWTGYVCNLPDSFKKSRLRVGFVGSYYTAYAHIKPRHAADTPLYLVLEKIKAL